MESKVDGDNAVFWVEVADDLSSSDVTIYIYYDKSDATTTSNGDNTFLLFDHFTDGSLNTSKWSLFDYGSGVASEPAGTEAFLDVHPASTSDCAGIKSVATFTSSFAVLIRRKQATNNKYYIGMSFGAGAVVDDAGGTTNYWQLSLRSGYWFRFYMSGSSSSLIYRNPTTGAPVAISTGAAVWDTCDVYAIWEMRYDQNGKLTWKIDDNTQSSEPTDTTFQTDNKHILINQGSYSGGNYGADTFIDYVFVRKYISSEPSHGVWGSEENKPANPTGKIYVIDKDNNLFRVDPSTMTEEKKLGMS
jgi:hypothetical protein